MYSKIKQRSEELAKLSDMLSYLDISIEKCSQYGDISIKDEVQEVLRKVCNEMRKENHK